MQFSSILGASAVTAIFLPCLSDDGTLIFLMQHTLPNGRLIICMTYNMQTHFILSWWKMWIIWCTRVEQLELQLDGVSIFSNMQKAQGHVTLSWQHGSKWLTKQGHGIPTGDRFTYKVKMPFSCPRPWRNSQNHIKLWHASQARKSKSCPQPAGKY